MDYYRTFCPLFAYGSHLARNVSERGGAAFSPAAVREDVHAILLAVYRDPYAIGPDFEDVWFAVRCWLHEILASLPDGDGLPSGLFDIPANGGGEFFTRLSRLLEDPGKEAVVRVYAACLELGFRGYYATPGREKDLLGYHFACRRYLARARRVDGETVSVPARNTHCGAVRAAAWLAPIGLTVALYCLYRFLLSGLYAAVVG